MDKLHQISLKLPAAQADMLIARMALSGLGMLAGLEAELIGDLGTVTNECCDCLMHQTSKPQSILVEAGVSEGRLEIRFSAQGEVGKGDKEPLDIDVVRGVLETLMPEVTVETDERGVCGIVCAMSV